MDLHKFHCKRVLTSNPTQKIIYLLGSVQGEQGEAIVIISPKVPKEQSTFSEIEVAFNNDIYTKLSADVAVRCDIQTIFPATEKHIKKYEHKICVLFYESGEDYAKWAALNLEKQLMHIKWVQNIIQGKAEQERVLHRSQDFVILPDFKFDDLKNTANLHILAIFTDPRLHSIRDLRGEHLAILQEAQKAISTVLQSQFQLSIQRCRVYFHYPPTFYQLHVHVSCLDNLTRSCCVERSHLLNSVMGNIELKGNYYAECTLARSQEKLE